MNSTKPNVEKAVSGIPEQSESKNMPTSKLKKIGYELESVQIVQAPISKIRHRSECDPRISLCGRRVYPVIVAPMGSVTDEHNYKTWLEHGFICVVPRTVDFDKRLEISKETFASFSLYEAETLVHRLLPDNEKRYICIDIAHGTMEALYNVCSELKAIHGNNIVIMTGNVAVPEAYQFYANNGIKYMRTTIGSGSRCTTRCNVGVGYPVATLIDELRMMKEAWLRSNIRTGKEKEVTEIIVDGGIYNFDDIQKCIALGAFCVMSGRIFAKAEEACDPIVYLQPDNLNMADAIPEDEYLEKMQELKRRSDELESDENEYWIAYKKLSRRKPYRLYYGMSTKHAQKLTGGSGKTTAEGIEKPILVEYPIEKWADNMASFLRSCMSYTGFRTIDQMRKDCEIIINASSEKSFRK